MLEDGCENCNNIRKRPSTVRYNSSKQAKRYGRGTQLGKQQSKGVSRARSSRDSRPRGSRRQQSERQAEQETTRSSNEKISRKDIETIKTARQDSKTAVTAQSDEAATRDTATTTCGAARQDETARRDNPTMSRDETRQRDSSGPWHLDRRQYCSGARQWGADRETRCLYVSCVRHGASRLRARWE